MTSYVEVELVDPAKIEPYDIVFYNTGGISIALWLVKVVEPNDENRAKIFTFRHTWGSIDLFSSQVWSLTKKPFFKTVVLLLGGLHGGLKIPRASASGILKMFEGFDASLVPRDAPFLTQDGGRGAKASMTFYDEAVQSTADFFKSRAGSSVDPAGKTQDDAADAATFNFMNQKLQLPPRAKTGKIGHDKKNSIQIPVVGRGVLYRARGSADGKFPPVDRAATIVEVNFDPLKWDHPLAWPAITIEVHNPKGIFFDEVKWHGDGAPGTWSWPALEHRRLHY